MSIQSKLFSWTSFAIYRISILNFEDREIDRMDKCDWQCHRTFHSFCYRRRHFPCATAVWSEKKWAVNNKKQNKKSPFMEVHHKKRQTQEFLKHTHYNNLVSK